MLAEFKQSFFNPLCFRCGSLFVEEHLFCETCFEDYLVPRLEMKVREIEFEDRMIKHYYLIEWIPGESDLISALIYQLKKDRSIKALRFYAKLMAKQWCLLQNGTTSLNCVLPLPGSSSKSIHSKILGFQIAQELSLKFRDVFRKTPSTAEQKHRSKVQRLELEIHACQNQVHELITDTKPHKLNPIYVDDVLTTGSTLKASISALRPDELGCVLTLFFRPPISIGGRES